MPDTATMTPSALAGRIERRPSDRPKARMLRSAWTPVVQQFVMGLLVGGGAGLLVLRGGELGISVLLAACLVAGLGVLACRYPTFTIAAWAFLTVHLREIVVVRNVAITSRIDALPSDPILLAIATATAFMLLSGDRRARVVLTGPCLFWSFLTLWIVFEIVRSVPASGFVSAIGEFKRTFQAFLVVPYVCIFFRTRKQQKRLFGVLLALSFLVVLIGLWEGGMVERFAISHKTRWVVAQSNLALLWGMVALVVRRQQHLDSRGNVVHAAILIAAILFTIICNHRSVWMAGAAAVGLLIGLGQLKIMGAFKVALVAVCAVIGLDLVYRDVDVLEFIRTRMMAFTAFESDPTANWRREVWTEAIRQSRSHWVAGKGFGSYFSLQLPDGRMVTTVLHNLYVQLAYQIGVVGLLLYLAFVTSTFARLWKSMQYAKTRLERAIAIVAVTVLGSASVFYLAYTMESSTWLYVGLGLAVAQSRIEAVRQGPTGRVGRSVA